MNLLDNSILKKVIACKDSSNLIVGVYESVEDAEEDLLVISTDDIQLSINNGTRVGPNKYRFIEMCMLQAQQPQADDSRPKMLMPSSNSSSVKDRGKHSHLDASVAVVQLDFATYALIEKFDSMYEAFCKTGARNISKCCKGKAKSSGGYRWMFAREYDELINS